MARPDLDDLQATLLSARVKTQRALDKHELGALSRVFDVDESGNPAFVVWQCRLPSGDGGDRNYEMLRLPWDSFFESEHLLKEISVSFDCDISKEASGTGGAPESYMLRPRKPDRSGLRHRFEMKLDADNDYVAEVTMDGAPLDLFLEQPEVASRLERLPFFKDLWLGLKGIRQALLQLLVILMLLAAPILAWLFFTGQI